MSDKIIGGAGVTVTGIVETRALLKQFEPDLLKRLDKRLNLVARDLKSGAQANFEKTGASGNAYQIRTRNRLDGFSKSVGSAPGRVDLREKWSTKPGVLAAVFELASHVRNSQPQNVQRTKSLIATLNAKYGGPPRFLGDAWAPRKRPALASIDAEIKAVEAEYTAKLRK